MSYLFFIAIFLSFIISYLLGRKRKSYWFMFGALFIGVVITVPTFLLFVRFGDIERLGLGVIAVLPVVLIYTSFFNTLISLMGIFIGVFFAKRKK